MDQIGSASPAKRHEAPGATDVQHVRCLGVGGRDFWTWQNDATCHYSRRGVEGDFNSLLMTYHSKLHPRIVFSVFKPDPHGMRPATARSRSFAASGHRPNRSPEFERSHEVIFPSTSIHRHPLASRPAGTSRVSLHAQVAVPPEQHTTSLWRGTPLRHSPPAPPGETASGIGRQENGTRPAAETGKTNGMALAVFWRRKNRGPRTSCAPTSKNWTSNIRAIHRMIRRPFWIVCDDDVR